MDKWICDNNYNHTIVIISGLALQNQGRLALNAIYILLWDLHLSTMQAMMPYFFAAGHANYARYGLQYLRSMQSLPESVLQKFQNGEHTMHHQAGHWNGIWSDMYIESTFMRYGHGKGGIIGITLKLETLKVWALSLHKCSQVESHLTAMTTDDATIPKEKHKEESTSRIVADKRQRRNS